MALGDILAAKLAPIIGGTVLGAVTETESDTAIKGVVSEVALREANELIQAGDKKLLISAEDVASAPETKDRVVISGIVYQIIQVDKEELNGVDIAYTLYLRA